MIVSLTTCTLLSLESEGERERGKEKEIEENIKKRGFIYEDGSEL